MAQRAPRNSQRDVARKKALLQNKIRGISRANKEELLIRAAIRDSVTGGDIVQTAIIPRGDNPRIVNISPDQTLDERKREVVREALSHLGDRDRDELLLAAGLRHGATAADIMQTTNEA
ncbi:hypothetical protein GQX73_g7647 [Xylaria multiplex]|uniref:Uncharacterized protein n=1 Tax=Xylaria multiplex TaxID=323545 RepID=A0A7C8IT94_9PEZI|nr:hypothetical protein GQX73_g7647 [Xylaria multiplex]